MEKALEFILSRSKELSTKTSIAYIVSLLGIFVGNEVASVYGDAISNLSIALGSIVAVIGTIKAEK